MRALRPLPSTVPRNAGQLNVLLSDVIWRLVWMPALYSMVINGARGVAGRAEEEEEEER